MSHPLPDLRRRVERLSPEQRLRLAERLGAQPAEASNGDAAGGRLVAFVVPRSAGTAMIEPAELRRFLNESLPEYMVPGGFAILDELPRTPNGKVDLRALPDPEPVASTADEPFVAPRNPAEDTLARIWAEVLGAARVGAHDDFFEIGGDSILSIQVVARANRAGLRLTGDQLFQYPTLAELAAVVGTAPSTTAEQGIVEGAVPLTPIQHWFFEQPLPEPNHWHYLLWLDAPGGLEVGLLDRALRRLMLHHDALRLRFARDGAEWRPVHGPADAPLRIRRVDLSGLTEAEQDAALRQSADELARATDLEEGPLVAALVAERGGGRSARVLFAIHHLVVDPLSWQVLLEDFETLFARLLRGDEDAALPAKTSSFRDWAEALVAYARSGSLRAEADYWTGIAADGDRIPTDHDGEFTEDSARTVVTALSPDETAALLHRVHGAYNTQVEDVLLTALARTLAAWTGRPRRVVGLERHGREAITPELDLSRTVGWFTSYFPVLLDLENTSQPGEALKSVKEQLRRVPNRGIGYGILRYLSPDAAIRERLRATPAPEVIFNYTGRATASGPAAGILQPLGFPTASRSPRNRRAHLLEINAFVDAGRLRLHWTYSANRHGAATLEQLSQQYLEALRELIEHCLSPAAGGFTPSDFPEAGLSQTELDRFLGRLVR